MKRSGRYGKFVHAAVALLAIMAMLPALGGQARAAGTATITVNSFQDDGTTPLPFVRFQVTDSNGTIYGPLESAPPDGKVSFTVDVDNDTTFTVSEETPPACGIAPDPVEVGPFADGDVKGVSISTSFLSSDDCNLGSISIYSYECPDGTDASGTDYATFQSACTTTVDGKSYRIADLNGSQTWDVVTGAYGISGRAPLVGLPPSTYQITDSAPADSTALVAYCSTYPVNPSDGSSATATNQMTVKNDAVSFDLNGDRMACDFFTVPTSDTSQPEPTAAPTDEPNDNGDVSQSDSDDGTAWLEVHLAQCPAGYSGNDLFDDCHPNGLADHTISLNGPNGFSDSAVTTLPQTPGPGVARFEDLYGGKYKVTEDVPGDAVTYYAYCSMADSDEVVDFTYDDTSSESIRLTIGAGDQIVCDLYIVPDKQTVATGKITVTKFTCPTGVESDAYADLSSDCTNKTDNITFTLSPSSGGSDQEAVSGASGTTGRVRFTNLVPDNYTLSEDVPGEFSTPAVWCNVAGGDWYQKEVSDAGATTFDVEAGDDIRCSWFNLPEDLRADGSIEIHKSLCPDGLTSGYYENCHNNPLAGVTFTTDGPKSFEQSLTTGDSGIVKFTDLASGDYTITEIPPDSVNVAVYVVSCTQDGNAFSFSYDDSTGLRINLKLPAGGQVVCDWYNVPPAKLPAGNGSITVIKFLCEGNKNNKYDWDKDCDDYGAGADFNLTSTANGVVASGSTGTNSKLVFARLGDGAYALEETSGDWCHAEADLVDAKGNVLVQSGGNTNVYIYNCSRSSISTLPSTGVGPSGGSGLGGWMLLWGVASLTGLAVLYRARRPRLAYVRVRH